MAVEGQTNEIGGKERTMTDEQRDSDNASYFGIPVGLMPKHNRLMSMPTGQWPAELLAFVRAQPGPLCGDVVACAVADWLKRNPDDKKGRATPPREDTMPDTGIDDSVGMRVNAAFDRLAAVAAELNALSDKLRGSVEQVDARLAALQMGVSAWVGIAGYGNRNLPPQLGYTKVNGKWSLALRIIAPTGENIYRFNDGPRALRALAVDYLPELLEKLESIAGNKVDELKERVERMEQLAGSTANVADEGVV